jgi:hypothetical protein
MERHILGESAEPYAIALPARGREMAAVGRKTSISEVLNLHSHDGDLYAKVSPGEKRGPQASS